MAAIRRLEMPFGTSRKTVTNMRRLLEQLELCGDAEGSFARQEVLAERLGVSVRQFRRWLLLAVEEGLVEITDSWVSRGGQFIRRRQTSILWERVLAGPRASETQLFLPFENVPFGQMAGSEGAEMAASSNKDIRSSLDSPSCSPPSEPEPQLEPEVGSIQGREWEELRDLLRGRGVVAVPRLLAGIRSQGIEPWAVFAVVRFWDAHRELWSVGALYRRLENLIPGILPESDWRSRWEEVVREWPPARASASQAPGRPSRGSSDSRPPRGSQTRSEVRTTRESAEAVNVRQVRDQRRREWQAVAARLERDWGPGFDRLSSSERERVVERLGGAWLLERWRRSSSSPEQRRGLRIEVLGLLESKGGKGVLCRT